MPKLYANQKSPLISLVSNNGLDHLDCQYLIIRMKSYVESVQWLEEISAISPQKIFRFNLAYQVLSRENELFSLGIILLQSFHSVTSPRPLTMVYQENRTNSNDQYPQCYKGTPLNSCRSAASPCHRRALCTGSSISFRAQISLTATYLT